MADQPLALPFTDAEIGEFLARSAELSRYDRDPESIECRARLAATLAELAGLRQDALRWQWFRSVATIGANEDGNVYMGPIVGDVDDGTPGLTEEENKQVAEGDGYWRKDDPNAARICDAIADAARSLPGALKQEKGND